uniref:hypothetical protein n=1 Tax=Paractinoplanes polyasparticus TaxID=2856853 RepID=UPI001C843968|nr:hypothetical protein [Actinoplanes polyasparticus]
MTKHPYWPDLTDDEGDALQELFDDTCGDCLEGRCHWGGEMSERAAREARHGHEFVDAEWGACGCVRHASSVLARPFQRDHETPQATAVAWRKAKAAGVIDVGEGD